MPQSTDNSTSVIGTSPKLKPRLRTARQWMYSLDERPVEWEPPELQPIRGTDHGRIFAVVDGFDAQAAGDEKS